MGGSGMNGKQAKRLRVEAELETLGFPRSEMIETRGVRRLKKATTRAVYKGKKRELSRY